MALGSGGNGGKKSKITNKIRRIIKLRQTPLIWNQTNIVWNTLERNWNQ